LDPRGRESFDDAGGQTPLELPRPQQHLDATAREGDANATIVVGIRRGFDQPLRFEPLDEGRSGWAGDTKPAGDVARAGAVGPRLVHRGEGNVGAVRQPVRAERPVPGAQ
jgi:hypothetical protein